MIQSKLDRISDTAQKWCVYKTSHPTGFYYYGKGRTAKVLSGHYKGSGVKLNAAWKFGGYPKEEWAAVVLNTFPSVIRTDGKDEGEIAAFAAEKEIVTFEMLCDPFCLNSMAGGNGGWKWKTLSSSSLQKRGRAISKALKGKKRGPQRKETVEKRARTLRALPETSKMRSGHNRKNLIVDGVRFNSVAEALEQYGYKTLRTCAKHHKVETDSHYITTVIDKVVRTPKND